MIKTECAVVGGNIRLTRSETFTARVEDEKFAEGKTKEAFKVSESGALNSTAAYSSKPTDVLQRWCVRC